MKLKEKNFLELEQRERRRINIWKEINDEHELSEYLEGDDQLDKIKKIMIMMRYQYIH